MAMQVIRDGIMLCTDCMFVAVNGDASGLEYQYGNDTESRNKRLAEIVAGLDRLGPHLVPSWGDDSDGNFSWRPCACCESRLGGDRFEFAILGEVS